MTRLSAEAYAIVEGRHSDPFHYLGPHMENDRPIVRAFLPQASDVEAIDESGRTAVLTRVHDAGLFTGSLPDGTSRYQLRARFGDDPCMLYVRGREVRVETTPPMQWQADGELMGQTPFDVVVEPLAVRLLVPAS